MAAAGWLWLAGVGGGPAVVSPWETEVAAAQSAAAPPQAAPSPDFPSPAAPATAPSPPSAGTPAEAVTAQRPAEPVQRPKNRAASIRALAEHFGVGAGATVADIGAGSGADSWLWADVVGPSGKVVAEEIESGSVERIRREAENRKLAQVEAILGCNDDPLLPADAIDLAYMHLVFHHFSQPREMLRGIRRGLRPGGHLVIVDRQPGTLAEWVPFEVRKDKHYWTAETSVVRMAREEGFEFVECAEPYWYERDTFALVFRRPEQSAASEGDPDAPEPLPAQTAEQLSPPGRNCRRPVFIAVGPARELIGPILRRSGGRGLEIVLEEWALLKDERGPLDEGVELPAVLTRQGDPDLDAEPIDCVFFLDSYHLLFHAPKLLAKLHERMTPGGRVWVLDRPTDRPLSRRESSHHRRIAPEKVRDELSAAGFEFVAQEAPPAKDRFLLVFAKKAEADAAGEPAPGKAPPDKSQPGETPPATEASS